MTETVRERDVEKYLVDSVKKRKGEVRKVRFIARRGAPDRLVLFPNYIAFVELKSPGVAPKAHQVREHSRLTKLGVNVFVIDSIEGVNAFLESIKA